MSFSLERVKQLAYLVRVKLTDDEARRIVKDFDTTMEWMKDLTAADTAGVEPLHSLMLETELTRVDEVDDGGYAERVTEMAPNSDGTFFVVPKVVE